MPERYELRAVFGVDDPKKLISYARRRHRACYPSGTKDPPPRPTNVAGALADSLIDCKDGPAVEELGLEYLSSACGPIREGEESALEAVRILYARTGGEGAFWEALTKFLEASLDGTDRSKRRARKTRR